ncbi:MAG: FtsK/SpoIIIE domain-containing protein [Planctomycetota bacterium]|nr:FtsK/SpoIIIE domain-containing protein [Planctomycetota bacterium]
MADSMDEMTTSTTTALAEVAGASSYTPDAMRAVITSLREEAATRASLERTIVADYENGREATKQEADRLIQETIDRYDDKIASTKREFEELQQRIEKQYRDSEASVGRQRDAKAAEISQLAEQKREQLKDDEHFAESTEADSFKDRRNDPGKLFARDLKQLEILKQDFAKLREKCLKILAERKVDGAESPPPAAAEQETPLPSGGEILAHVKELHQAAVDAVKNLAGLTAAKAGAGMLNVFGRTKLLQEASQAAFAELERDFLRADKALAAAAAFLAARRDQQRASLEKRYKEDVERRKNKLLSDIETLTAKRDAELAALEAKAAAAVESAAAKRRELLEQAGGTYPPAIEKLEAQRAERMATIETKRDHRLAELESRRASRWQDMVDRWRVARESATETVRQAAEYDAAAFADWDRLATDDAAFPADAPVGLRFGQLAVALEKIKGGVSPHAELNAYGPTAWQQPSMTPFPDAASLLIKTSAGQADVASEMMQAMMLRIATGIPAGQTRFTIIDPVGLGKHFAGFMHLADYDELLVNSRIWTEPTQIEQRLADITEQMELVIQKYLRNEYASIGSYNQDAEVPEPYRFVVVANFPANFTETSARRLISIASSGARCGVSTIISVDTKQQLPPNFSIDELAKYATVLDLQDGRFRWSDPEFSNWPLAVEQSPGDDVMTKIVHNAGRLAKAAKRVEVPFDRVAPEEGDWWTGDSGDQIDVPLGPAGAKKMQHMKLGKGTSQHVLIAGKTGSGKSTMMHALITNLALTYSPNEVQFYLIDFKKGVEFKVYDHYKLPHARVIAIESEREFGLSVLQQLDSELKRRGDLFRDLAVQNLAGYRASGHPEPMPRILLIIDEFQEIFIEDDKLAQDASLVLDRLVRQGRAFGMHVLLGSQTLGGSYSLPRSTMGQMAVRIALQCNEADSSLILSEDNSAARLLTRPGEAIYNDANGMVEGNNPFQVVWLGDERREKYLGALQQLAARRPDMEPLSRIVFDGNQAADPAGNSLLGDLLSKGTAESGPLDAKELAVAMAWLGDAIAIKDPTAAPFRRQGGSNLLIVGQRQDLATSLLAMAMVGLAAGHDPFPGGGLGRPARFVLFEPAIAEEHPETMLAQFAELLPHRLECVGRLGVGDAIERIAGEVQRRLDEQVLDSDSIFVVVRDLARFREFRKSEGDFGFSFGSEQKLGPAQHFINILKDGPTVGVHTIVWCDSLTNLMRTFERGTLKEFELRVLFQMSGSDSSQLVETPIASKLGPQRALFIHEETGTLEKFRPYAFPQGEWLAGVTEAMRARPQGTPVDDPPPPPPRPAAKPAADDGESFNFTSFLDDPPPLESPPPADAHERDKPAADGSS